MKTQRPRRQRGAEYRKRFLYTPLTVLLICAALFLGMSVFFKVSKITVEGSTLYTPEEVIEASGIELGENLFFINRF